jgi:hypothetical protein
MRRLVLLVLAGLSAAVFVEGPKPAAAQDCVSCEIDSCECDVDAESDACRCIIKVIHGTCFCVQRDFLCDLSGSCDADPPSLAAPATFAIEPKALAKLEAKEPLLSLVLRGVVEYTKDKQPVLNLEPDVRGTINGKEGRYIHRGFFSRRGNDQVAFHFELENADDGSKVTLSGIIRDRGRAISYSKLTKSGASVRRERFEWKAAD